MEYVELCAIADMAFYRDLDGIFHETHSPCTGWSLQNPYVATKPASSALRIEDTAMLDPIVTPTMVKDAGGPVERIGYRS